MPVQEYMFQKGWRKKERMPLSNSRCLLFGSMFVWKPKQGLLKQGLFRIFLWAKTTQVSKQAYSYWHIYITREFMLQLRTLSRSGFKWFHIHLIFSFQDFCRPVLLLYMKVVYFVYQERYVPPSKKRRETVQRREDDSDKESGQSSAKRPSEDEENRLENNQVKVHSTSKLLLEQFAWLEVDVRSKVHRLAIHKYNKLIVGDNFVSRLLFFWLLCSY